MYIPSVPDTPVVMAFSDLDPSGASGIQADVETLFSMGCHCSSVATSITSQDTYEFRDSVSIDPDVINDQARAILEDMMVTAFKIGLVNSLDNVHAIYQILLDYPEKPVIFGPQLTSLHSQFSMQIVDSIRALLLPLSNIVSITANEAHLLCPLSDTLEASVQEILDSGSEYVLVSDIGQDLQYTLSRLYSSVDDSNLIGPRQWQWKRLPHTYLGSGSTLAASISAHIAQGFDPITAMDKAQHYTFNSMKSGRRMGMGQYVPNRMFWRT